MSRLMTDDAMRTVRRQMRRVRWRRNGYTIQRAVYLLVALLAAAGALLVVLAVRTGELAFALATCAVAGVALAVVGAVVVATARDWLRPIRTAAWIDRRAALEGRLATLSEVASRPGAEPDFLPLLVEQNLSRLRSWDPERLLPDTFPGGALGTAAVAVSALMAALAIAPRLDPPPVTTGSVRLVDRVTRLVGRHRRATDEEVVGTATVAEDRGGILRLPGTLQDEIRRALWGTRWQALQQAMRDVAPRASASATAERAADIDPEQAWRIARSAPRARQAAAGDTETGAGISSPTDATEPSPADEARRATEEGPSAHGRPARGAGTGTDPDLLGAATTTPGVRRTMFDLPIAARVRATGAAAGPPAGDAPPAAPDTRPDLGATQRRDAPVLRPEISIAWAPVVRRLFAHAEATDP